MPEKTLPQAKYIIVCEDIREEKNNKAFLIGVYSGYIIIKSLPTLLPKIAFRICFDMKAPKTYKIMFSVQKPDGNNLAPLLPIEVRADDESVKEAYVNIIMAPFIIDLEGTYKINVSGDGKERQIGEFIVKMAKK